MKYLKYLFLLIAGIVVSCHSRPAVIGRISFDHPGEWRPKAYLIDPLSFDGIATSYLGKVIDSATILADGSFFFETMPDAPQPVLLQIAIQKKDEKYLNKLENDSPTLSNYFPIIWQNGKNIEFTSTADHFQRDFSFKHPSYENTAIAELRDIRQEGFKAFQNRASSDIHDGSQLLEVEHAQREFQKPLMQVARNTPYLLVGLVAIRWISIDANYERIAEFIFDQCEKWKKDSPQHDWVAQLCNHASRENLPLLISDVIPDFPMPMLSGDTITMHHLLGKKLTILDLWASWCIPCRHENRDYLVPIWDNYHKKGLQIVGYALDSSLKVWKAAIDKDGASRWLNASHLQGDDAPLFKALRIVTIPANFLIDAQGKIVAKNLQGEELTEFVEEFMAI
jgi:thiol-disulfide isomerase/thioredoxin